MVIDKVYIMDLFYRANENFLNRNYLEIMRNSSERSMCANLKEETSILLRNSNYHMYFVDVEYNRNKEEIKTVLNLNKIINVTCDFLIHSRGTQKHENILALEMKKSSATQKEKDADRDRLIALTMSEGNTFKMGGNLPVSTVCGYSMGIYYEIDTYSKIIYLEYYENGEMISFLRKPFDYFMNYTTSLARMELVKKGL